MTATTTASSPGGSALSRDRRRSLHRDCCVALLRRYFNVCAEIGRLPSLLGREFFAARRSPRHRPTTFEDAVIFSIDVERCLDALDAFDRELIARVVLQEHSEEDAARMLRCHRVTLARRLPRVLDQLADTFLERGLLKFRCLPPEPGESEPVSLEAGAAAAPHTMDGSVVRPFAKLPVEICCQAPLGGPTQPSA